MAEKYSAYYFNDKEKGTAFFTAQLKQGHKWTNHIAGIFQENNIECYVDKMHVAKTVDERKKFHNEKDIVFTKMPGCIETKSQSRHFTEDPKSFPFKKTIVDTELGWSRKNPKPLAVVLVSIQTGNSLVIPRSTEGSWWTENIYDNFRKISDTFLCADIKVLRPLDELIEFLQKRQHKYCK
jgi:hypothetical protein